MKRYAWLISCEEYTDFDDISFCHSDAFLMKETLESFCDYEKKDVEILTLYIGDENGKVEGLYQTLDKIVQKMTCEDTFLFYFAGHGLAEGEDEFFILPDTQRDNIANTALSLKKINEILKKGLGNTFRIIDACHSGKDVRGVRIDSFCEKVLNKSWGTLASCAENECSYPDREFEQGVFTYYVAEEIKRWETEADINFENLKIRVCSDLEEWGKKNGVVQTPTLNGSLVGNIAFATRNKKEYRYTKVENEIVLNQRKEEKIVNEVGVVGMEETNIKLWEPNGGIEIPKSADAVQVLGLNVQIKPQIIKTVHMNFINEAYEAAAEVLWNRAIALLKKRVLALGEEFVGEMVGINNLEYIRALPEFEVINLAMELGFINNTGKMRLMHAYETITHYCEENSNAEMTKSEAENIIRACVQYIIGFDEADVVIEYNDFRQSLKLERFDTSSPKMEMLKNSPYFYKKTTVRTFVNLISTTDGAEFENVIANFNVSLPIIWDSLSADDKYFLGITYSKYVNNGEKKYVLPIREVLVKVGGFDYVPENLRSLSFVNVAKRIKSVHYALNNFYNEPSVVVELEKMGTQIPKPAIKECISAIFMVLMGNAYGRSHAAVEPAESVLRKLTESDWKYYINECLPYDEAVLYKMRCGDDRTNYWCDIINKFELNKYDFGNTKVNEFIAYSVKRDRNNVKAIAGMYLKKLGSE